ncbi:MAG: hypothetical protein JW913_19095 [Chitinispirillaceae bacterium]|nr:hypothetical protein [Chitinispirillaceae bacterium]
MQFLKITCTRCSHYSKCPQRTRMYVNYCGSDFKQVEHKVIDATLDCRTRRGLLLTQNLLSVIPIVPVVEPVLASASS